MRDFEDISLSKDYNRKVEVAFSSLELPSHHPVPCLRFHRRGVPYPPPLQPPGQAAAPLAFPRLQPITAVAERAALENSGASLAG